MRWPAFRISILINSTLEKIMDNVELRDHVVSDLQELSADEIECVGGGRISGGAALGAAAAIGGATFGSTWGAMGVAAAFGIAPVAVIAMSGLVAYGVYRCLSDEWYLVIACTMRHGSPWR